MFTPETGEVFSPNIKKLLLCVSSMNLQDFLPVVCCLTNVGPQTIARIRTEKSVNRVFVSLASSLLSQQNKAR
jgi:hypothetical protein